VAPILARRCGSGTPTLTTIACALAAHAAVAVIATLQEQQLEAALLSRGRIGQAKGIIMERFGIDDVQHSRCCVRLSQDENTKVTELAERAIDTRPD